MGAMGLRSLRTCPIQFYYCCDDQSNLVGEVLFGLPLNISTHQLRKSEQELKQDRNPEVGTDAENMEESCLLACSSWIAQAAFS